MYHIGFYILTDAHIVAGQHPGRAAVDDTGGGGPARGAQGPWPGPRHGLHRLKYLIISIIGLSPYRALFLLITLGFLM
jgi:hypothetical protein